MLLDLIILLSIIALSPAIGITLVSLLLITIPIWLVIIAGYVLKAKI